MKINMVAALNQALDQAMAKDNTVVVLGEDVGVDGGVFRVTEGLIAKYPNRVFDTPLAEAGIVGCATGMAINGLKPIPEMQFDGFSLQAFHHVEQHLARFRQRSNGTFGVPMVLRIPCAGGIRALEHHSESIESFFIHCQGLKVVCPSGPHDAKGLLLAAINDPDPVIFFEPKSLYRTFKEEVPEEMYEIEIGKANIVRPGNKLTIVTWGAMVRLSLQAVEEMQVDAEVIDLRTLWPLDIETILQSVQKTNRVVIVHEASVALGLGAEIAAQIQEKAILSLEAPVVRVGALNIPFPAFSIEKMHIPDVHRIKNGINKAMNF
jgi:pyruvate/2-oxoglutarate/acetoin dehydrogenase E1 component